MYKAHIPVSNSQINLGVTFNSLMEKVERTQYQAALAITGIWHAVINPLIKFRMLYVEERQISTMFITTALRDKN